MSNKGVVEFLRKEALSLGYKVFNSIHGESFLGQNFPISQSSGAVYGILVKSEKIDRVKSVLGHEDWLPVYWGKDIHPLVVKIEN